MTGQCRALSSHRSLTSQLCQGDSREIKRFITGARIIPDNNLAFIDEIKVQLRPQGCARGGVCGVIIVLSNETLDNLVQHVPPRRPRTQTGHVLWGNNFVRAEVRQALKPANHAVPERR